MFCRASWCAHFPMFFGDSDSWSAAVQHGNCAAVCTNSKGVSTNLQQSFCCWKHFVSGCTQAKQNCAHQCDKKSATKLTKEMWDNQLKRCHMAQWSVWWGERPVSTCKTRESNCSTSWSSWTDQDTCRKESSWSWRRQGARTWTWTCVGSKETKAAWSVISKMMFKLKSTPFVLFCLKWEKFGHVVAWFICSAPCGCCRNDPPTMQLWNSKCWTEHGRLSDFFLSVPNRQAAQAQKRNVWMKACWFPQQNAPIENGKQTCSATRNDDELHQMHARFHKEKRLHASVIHAKVMLKLNVSCMWTKSTNGCQPKTLCLLATTCHMSVSNVLAPVQVDNEETVCSNCPLEVVCQICEWW